MSEQPVATMDLTDVRRHHLSIVLRTLLADGPRSRSELAHRTGLTKGTVSALVSDLSGRQLLEELDTPRRGRVGRPATAVAASGRTIGGLGIEIGVDHVAAAIVDLGGEIRADERHEADNATAGPPTIFRRARQVTRAVLEQTNGELRCVGATLAVPGLVDPATGTLVVAPNLRSFDADVSGAASQIGLPDALALSIDNEANLGALAELRAGAGRGLSSFVYLSGGLGIGAGIVWDRRLVRGSRGFAGEVGHVVVDPRGAPCSCGARGCLETVARADSGAEDAAVAEALALALRSVVHVLDPQAVVLGGSFADRGQVFAAMVQDRLGAIALGARWSSYDVRTSELGADAALLGAASVAIDAVIADPTLVPIAAIPDARPA